MLRQIEIAGKRLWAGQPEELLAKARQERKQLISLNAESLVSEDKRFCDIINSNIGFADGVGAVYAAARKGHSVEKIPGCELWLKSLQCYNGTPRVWLIGATEEVNRTVAEKLMIEFPNIELAGRINGYFGENQLDALLAEVRSSQPTHVFVALGQPRQELLIEELKSGVDGICMGIGGAFDVYSGVKKRAPRLFVNTHTEWAYRFLKEPKRIGRSIAIPRLLWRILRNKI